MSAFISRKPNDRIGVIGGGLGGLAAACVLAARGHRVVLLEANDWLGGKAAEWREGGYRFDLGPTILTIPEVLRRIFAEAGRKFEDVLDLVRLEPQWRSFFDDGSTLDLLSDDAPMAVELERFSPGSSEGFHRFLEDARGMHDLSERLFFWRSVGGVRDMFQWPDLLRPQALGELWRMRPFRTVAKHIRGFASDARVAQMLDHFTQYVGSSPENSPAVLCGIAHMQTRDGVWYPRGGTRAVPLALACLAENLGVEIRLRSEVRKIVTDRGAVTGVELADGETIALRAVVSNMDSVRTHRELLGKTAAASAFERRRSYEAACSGVVLYLGLRERYPQLTHHNFVFSRDPHEEFEAIYERGEPAPDPTCYVCAPAVTEPGVAPPGGEALYVLVHAPYLRAHHDWEKMLPEYRRTILRKLEYTAGLEDLEDRIAVERVLTPQDIHDRYRVLHGAIYGLASHGKLFGAFKPANRSPDVRGLYLAGGSAHPGPGMPMVLMSGWIAADTLDRDLGGVHSVAAETMA